METLLDTVENGDGDHNNIQFAYKKPRKCLKVMCRFEAQDPVDMFKHIRQQHVKISV